MSSSLARRGSRRAVKRASSGVRRVEPGVLTDLRRLIEEARREASVAVNAGMTLLYWRVGRRVREEVLSGERGSYGEKIVASVARALEADHGRAFSEKNLRRMMQFYDVFPDEPIVVSLIRQLTWTHFLALIPVKDPLAREFYAEMCRAERWNVRTLRAKVQGMLFERTALSRKPESLAKKEVARLRDEDRMSPDLVFRDPYVLHFLGLEDTYSEKDLESAIVRELGNFILELGVGFAFVERQKRITIDARDYYLDLLFYHRRLKRLVAVELKLGDFQAADKGQMELYLRWLDRHERLAHEDQPLGLILCAGKSDEHVELLEVERSGIRVAEYLTELPPEDVLCERLRKMVIAARDRIAKRPAAGGPDIEKSTEFPGLTSAYNTLRLRRE
jgi:predicted nuclease of restriction endonuclease-like (RecB) superfamily